MIGCRWPGAAQTTALAFVTKFGGRIADVRLQARGSVDNNVGGACHQVGWGIPAQMLMAGGGADNAVGGALSAGMLRSCSSADNIVVGPCHQVWRQAPY